MTQTQTGAKAVRPKRTSETVLLLRRNWDLYLLLFPALAYIVLFHYVPLYGVQIAFRNYNPYDGILGSPWVGFEHFTRFFQSAQFWNLLRNTLGLSFYSLLAGFPIPILLALMLNHCASRKFQKTTQMISYIPHFISVVVLVGILQVMFQARGGLVNIVLIKLGLVDDPVLFLSDAKYFRHLYVWSGIWQNMGWSSIIYIATLSGVSPELHEAAIVDGANKLQRIRYVDFPSILPTAIILFIMDMGKFMSVGFEKAFLMQNDANLISSEIISTYTYKIGIVSAQFSYSAAIGLFNNVVNFVMLIVVNRLARQVSGASLW
jgi:putative aldouronate transport system permease protein